LTLKCDQGEISMLIGRLFDSLGQDVLPAWALN
jgi:hypothetical protein